MFDEPMLATWVVGVYEGEKAKNALELGDSSVGYIVLDRGGTKLAPACRVAFRFALDKPIPEGLTVAKDPFKIAEYEKTRLRRLGGHVDEKYTANANPKTISNIREQLVKKGIINR